MPGLVGAPGIRGERGERGFAGHDGEKGSLGIQGKDDTKNSSRKSALNIVIYFQDQEENQVSVVYEAKKETEDYKVNSIYFKVGMFFNGFILTIIVLFP